MLSSAEEPCSFGPVVELARSVQLGVLEDAKASLPFASKKENSCNFPAVFSAENPKEFPVSFLSSNPGFDSDLNRSDCLQPFELASDEESSDGEVEIDRLLPASQNAVPLSLSPFSFLHTAADALLERVVPFVTNSPALLPLVALMVMGSKGRTRGKPKAKRSSANVAKGGSRFNPGETFSPSNRMGAFPLYIRRTLRYAQTNVIDVANFGTNQQVFRANSLYDPDYTGGGHQPNGFDQLIAAYNHFTVLRARLRVRVLQVGSGGGVIEPGAIVLAWSDSGTFMASQADYPSCIEKRNVLASAFYGSSTSTGNTFTLTGSLDVLKLLRKKQNELVEMANLRGSSAANPVEGYFLEVGLFSFSSNPGAITVISDIEFDSVFTEPVTNFGDS